MTIINIEERRKETDVLAANTLSQIKERAVYAYVKESPPNWAVKGSGLLRLSSGDKLGEYKIMDDISGVTAGLSTLSTAQLIEGGVAIHDPQAIKMPYMAHLNRIKAIVSAQHLDGNEPSVIEALVKADALVNAMVPLSKEGQKRVYISVSNAEMSMPYELKPDGQLKKVYAEQPELLLQSPEGNTFNINDVSQWLKEDDVPNFAKEHITLLSAPPLEAQALSVSLAQSQTQEESKNRLTM